MEPKLRANYDEPLNTELKNIIKKVDKIVEGKQGPPGPQGPPGVEDEPIPLMYIDGIF